LTYVLAYSFCYAACKVCCKALQAAVYVRPEEPYFSILLQALNDPTRVSYALMRQVLRWLKQVEDG
jgi:hypothetical protein